MNGSARLPAWLWTWLIVFVGIGVFGAWVTTAISPRVYSATATEFVSTGSASAGADAELQSLAATVYVQTRLTSYARLATSDVVLARTIGDLRLGTTPERLAPSITASARPGSLLIDLTVTASSRAKARDLVSEISRNLRDVIDTTVEDGAVAGGSLVHIRIVNSATAERAPQYPRAGDLMVGGGIMGALLWLGIVLILGRLTARIRSALDVSLVTDLPVLTRMERLSSSFRIAVSVQSNPGGSIAESVRQLRTNLAFTDSGNRPIVITSCVPNEGKTTTAVNLALAMALAGERVLLIDADLRRPSIAGLLNLDGRTGLTNVLRRGMRLDDVVQTWGVDSPFALLPSGSVPPNPSELIGSHRMRALLAEVSAQYDRVIIDAPPILAATDAGILGAETGALLMVVGMGRMTREQLGHALEQLASAGSSPLGLALNLVEGEDQRELAAREVVSA